MAGVGVPNRTVLSAQAAAIRCPSGLKATVVTVSVCPVMFRLAFDKTQAKGAFKVMADESPPTPRR